MRDSLEAQLNRVSISHRDFMEAREYLMEWSEEYPEVIRRALLTSAVVAYSRPYLNSKINKRATQRVSLSEPRPNAEQEGLHQKVVTLRKEAVAHSDFHRKPTRTFLSFRGNFAVGEKTFDVLAQGIDLR